MPSAAERLALARQRRAQEYAKLAADKRPHSKVERCDDCGEEIYQRELCRRTAHFHPSARYRIEGVMRIPKDVNVFEGKLLAEMLDRRRVRPQTDRFVKRVCVDTNSFQAFLSRVQSTGWSRMRYGVCYGTVEYENKIDVGEDLIDTSKNSVECVYVHAIFEPKQSPDAGVRQPLIDPDSDPSMAMADAVAAAMGMGRVGLICTYLKAPADGEAKEGEADAEQSYPPAQVLAIARQQALHGPHCVCISVGCGEGIVPAGIPFQASAQLASFVRFGIFSTKDDDNINIHTNQPLEVIISKTERKELSAIDVAWFSTKRAAIQAFNSPLRCSFARDGKVTQDYIRSIITAYLIDGSIPALRAYQSTNAKTEPKENKLFTAVSDFGLLVSLFSCILTKSDIEPFFDAVRTNDLDRLHCFESIIKGTI